MTKLICNGKIYLGRENFCEALVIERGRIIRTGQSREISEAAPAGAEKIDAEGALVLPAFYDSHLHLMWVGRREGGIDGAGAKSIEDVIERGRLYIEKNSPPPGTYVEGAGINPDLFSAGEKRDLRREDLDRISTAHPVILSRHCGHTIYCNSLALKMAGLSEAAPAVDGGTIETGANGRPSGILRENANAYARKPMPGITRGDKKTFLRLAMKKAHSLGICSCGSNDSQGADFEDLAETYREIYDESRAAGAPALRVAMQCGVSASEELLDARLDRGLPFGAPLWEDPDWGTFLKLGPLKLFADGTLGGQTAWMRKPYRDKPESRGFPVVEDPLFKRLVQKAAANGVQVIVHAIGDAGIDAALSAFEKITGGKKNPLRHGIVHCQITSPDLLERMARNNILALVQPVFLADDRHILESRVGAELAATSYAWGTMQKIGIEVSYGTDAPVSPLDPLSGIEWAALRGENRDANINAFNPHEKVDVYSAVDAYTRGAAFSGFDENALGRIAPGYFADLIFLDRDIFGVPPNEIHKARVIKTICAGETVYQ